MIQGAIDSILIMENEFGIFTQTNLMDVWRNTLQVEYKTVAREAVEADFGWANSDSLLQDDNMAAK
eukprot:9776712-Alexandrium_andersonii.AAC.1